MSTHIVAFRPPDERWQQMKSVWDACQAADVEVPESVEEFFNGEDPDPAGVEVSLTGYSETHASVREWSDESKEGYEVILADLPPGITIVRFYNSW